MLIVRRVLRVLLMTVAAVIVVAGALAALTQTSWFKVRLRDYIVRESGQYPNGQLSIQKLGGNLFSGIELENIELSMDGSRVVAVQSLALDYRVAELVGQGLSLDYIRLNKPVVYLRRDAEGWSLGRLLKKQAREADREGPKRPINIGDISISDGLVVVDEPNQNPSVDVPRRFERLDARVSFKYEPVRYSIDVAHLSFRGHDPDIGLNNVSGGFAVADDAIYLQKVSVRTQESSLSIDGAIQQYLKKPVFNLRISSDKLSIPELSHVVRSLSNVRLQPAFELTASGPLDRLEVDANVRSAAGQIAGKVTTNLTSSVQSVAGKVSLRHLNLAPFFADPERTTDITADGDINLTGSGFSKLNSLRGSVRLTAPRIVTGNVIAERVDGAVQIAGRPTLGRWPSFRLRRERNGQRSCEHPAGRRALDLRSQRSCLSGGPPQSPARLEGSAGRDRHRRRLSRRTPHRRRTSGARRPRLDCRPPFLARRRSFRPRLPGHGLPREARRAFH